MRAPGLQKLGHLRPGLRVRQQPIIPTERAAPLGGVALSGVVIPGPTIIHLQMGSKSDERTAPLVA